MVEAIVAGAMPDLLRLVAEQTLDAKGRDSNGSAPITTAAGFGNLTALQILLTEARTSTPPAPTASTRWLRRPKAGRSARYACCWREARTSTPVIGGG